MAPRERTSVTAPESRHNLHVRRESDLLGIGPWSKEQLYAAVERADTEGEAVVLDYGHGRLYLAETGHITYLPPTALGFAGAPGIRVKAPRTYDPDDDCVGRTRVGSVTVSPEFDILIPAFEWPEPDDEWEPPELDYRERPSGSPAGATGG